MHIQKTVLMLCISSALKYQLDWGHKRLKKFMKFRFKVHLIESDLEILGLVDAVLR